MKSIFDFNLIVNESTKTESFWSFSQNWFDVLTVVLTILSLWLAYYLGEKGYKRDNKDKESNKLLEETFSYVIKKYNSSIENIISIFERIGFVAKGKGVKYDSVFGEIGKTLNDGYSPTVKQIYYASYYISTFNNL